MRMFRRVCCLVFSAVFSLAALDARSASLTVEVFEGTFPSVNSFIFSNGESLVVMDVQRTSEAARELADIVKARDLPLTHILVSHGHTDHFMGLDVFRRAFPTAKIVVHTEAIKEDIQNYARWMSDGGWLDEEPAMKPASPENPEGFDYEKEVQVLADNTLVLDGGGVLELTSDYRPTEGQHMTTVFVEELNALFLADLGFNDVHLWMGAGVTQQHVTNWRGELENIKRRYAHIDPVVYPGHGPVTDLSLVDEMIAYIDDFNRVIATSDTEADAVGEMTALYPDYEQADFLLKWSVNNHMQLRKSSEANP